MVGVVVEPDARAEQDWCDVQVDLVDQAELKQLTSDVGRENLDVLAPGRLQRDAHRLVHRTTKNGDALGLTRVLRVVGENKDGALPRAPYGRESPIALSKPSRPASTAPVVSMYSACRPARKEMPVIQSMLWFGPATNPSKDIRKCHSTFPPAICGSVSFIVASCDLIVVCNR